VSTAGLASRWQGTATLPPGAIPYALRLAVLSHVGGSTILKIKDLIYDAIFEIFSTSENILIVK
jgi:hypothetical protein